MVPPVQRIANVSLLFYRNRLPPSIKFRIPWTGGNPKLSNRRLIFSREFRIPWTGGNPKQLDALTAFERKFRIPWTGGNPKHDAIGTGYPP